MESYAIILAPIISLLFTLLALPYWIVRSRQHRLLITDAQKVPTRKVAYLAGLIVIPGATIGILFFIATQTFLEQGEHDPAVLLAAVSTMLFALIIGVMDDLLGERIGLRQYQKPFLMLFAAMPLIVIHAGENIMHFPFIGTVALGNIYPFVIVPLAIVGASNGFNMLAGLNGLEAGMGIIILGTLGTLALVASNTPAAVIALCAVGALIAFFWFNKFPARILPGNGFTYSIGATIAVVAIVGDLERSALLLFIPYFLELILKIPGKLQKESLARPLANGTLVNKYPRWYSLNHIAISLLRGIKRKAFEWEATLILLSFETLIAIGTLALSLK